ncbi:MAG TPA: hypothetical protein VGV38_11745 [Pyrinomonadaceae bacterium]|nr:hypothetical protein [Pyrinomonadaceae bacterium]
MPNRIFALALCAALALALAATPARARDKRADFGDVVKLIEKHYGVRSRGIPLVARAGIGVARRLTRYGELGSFKVAFFEDQSFRQPSGAASLRSRLSAAVEPEWSPLVHVSSDANAEQNFVYARDTGKYFKILVVSIQQRDAVVVQADISPQKLMLLLKDPDSAARNVTDEATSSQ